MNPPLPACFFIVKFGAGGRERMGWLDRTWSTSSSSLHGARGTQFTPSTPHRFALPSGLLLGRLPCPLTPSYVPGSLSQLVAASAWGKPEHRGLCRVNVYLGRMTAALGFGASWLKKRYSLYMCKGAVPHWWLYDAALELSGNVRKTFDTFLKAQLFCWCMHYFANICIF